MHSGVNLLNNDAIFIVRQQLIFTKLVSSEAMGRALRAVWLIFLKNNAIFMMAESFRSNTLYLRHAIGSIDHEID